MVRFASLQTIVSDPSNIGDYRYIVAVRRIIQNGISPFSTQTYITENVCLAPIQLHYRMGEVLLGLFGEPRLTTYVLIPILISMVFVLLSYKALTTLKVKSKPFFYLLFIFTLGYSLIKSLAYIDGELLSIGISFLGYAYFRISNYKKSIALFTLAPFIHIFSVIFIGLTILQKFFEDRHPLKSKPMILLTTIGILYISTLFIPIAIYYPKGNYNINQAPDKVTIPQNSYPAFTTKVIETTTTSIQIRFLTPNSSIQLLPVFLYPILYPIYSSVPRGILARTSETIGLNLTQSTIEKLLSFQFTPEIASVILILVFFSFDLPLLYLLAVLTKNRVTVLISYLTQLIPSLVYFTFKIDVYPERFLLWTSIPIILVLSNSNLGTKTKSLLYTLIILGVLRTLFYVLVTVNFGGY